MEAKHTPGEWAAKPVTDTYFQDVNVCRPDGLAVLVAVQNGDISPEEAWANALLGATAPELLEIVRRLLAAEDEAPEFGLADCIDNNGDHYQSADFAALILDARTALAKAEAKS